MNDDFWKYFHEIYEDLPRQGPASTATTERALGMLPPLTAASRILDLGCGTGAQTMDLARACPASIVAVDIHGPFVERLNARARELGLADRVTGVVGDMGDLAYPDASFDVVWCEGAAFIIGFERALEEWRRLLVPGGHIGLTDFVWTRPNPPDELQQMFLDEGASQGTLEERHASIEKCGYELIGEFVLPESCWRDEYHAPLRERVARFKLDHAGDEVALQVAAHSEGEMALFEKYPDWFTYVFFTVAVAGA